MHHQVVQALGDFPIRSVNIISKCLVSAYCKILFLGSWRTFYGLEFALHQVLIYLTVETQVDVEY